MADRFYSEGSKNNGSVGSNSNAGSPRQQNTNPYSKIPTKGLGDFSENIDSNDSGKRGYVQPHKKFEVHIDDFNDFVGMPDPPAAPRTPKPISADRTVERRVVPPVSQVNRRAPEANNNRRVAKPSVIREKVQKIPKTASPSSKNNTDKRTTEKKVPNSKKAPVMRQLTPEQQAKLKAKKRYNFIKTTLIACVCIIFISIITVSASTIAIEFVNDILAIDRQGGSVNVEIPEGAEFDDVFNILEQNGLIKQKTLCYMLLKIRDYDTVDYQPGVYYLDRDAGVEINIETIMTKKSGTKGTVRLTFPEGWTIAQIFEKIEKYDVCSAEKLYANLDIVGKQYGFLKNIKADSDRYLKYEGYLFPDTYDFFIDEGPASVLKKLFNNFDSKWTEEYSQRAKELGLTVDEVINIAAIIQREAKDSSQMSTVSSVIHNRLAAPSTYPSLDMNSTKDYIASLEKYNLFSEFYLKLYESSYNTYSATGLPPGPICNPGNSAIKAALYPADTNYYYFMHSPSGDMYVAETRSEHEKNVMLYLYG